VAAGAKTAAPKVSHVRAPLSKPALMKLGYRSGERAAFIAVPRGFEVPESAESPATLDGDYDFILIFIENQTEAQAIASSLKPSLKANGKCWIAWPKGGASDINRDKLSGLIETSASLSAVMNVAIDERWSALKFMYPKEERG
jgi:hypothetical protein